MDIKKKIKNGLNSLTEEQSAYVLCAILFLFIFLLKPTILFFEKEFSNDVFWVPVLIAIYGFIYYWVNEFSRFWKSIFGKVVVTAILTIAGTLSLAFANQAINGTFQVTASPFEYTQIMLSVLLSPLIASILFGLFGFILFPVLMFMSVGFPKPFSIKAFFKSFFKGGASNKPAGFTLIVRFVLLILLIGIALEFNQKNEWYTSPLGNFSKWFAYNFEMEKYSYCDLKNNEKIAYIDSNNIIIGLMEDDNYMFKQSTCNKQ